MKLLRRCRLWKIILILVIFVIFLQIFHISLLTQLESKETKELSDINKILADIESEVRIVHRMDKSEKYIIIANILQANSRSGNHADSDEITLTTQCSSNHLHHLLDLIEVFKGSISVTVFTYDTDIEYAVQSIAYYHFCHKRIQQHVTFHMVYPVDRSPTTKNKPWDISFNCDNTPAMKKNENYAIKGIEYPHNVLRNLAIKYSRTLYIMLIDIDMIPSRNLQTSFQNMQQKYTFLKNSSFISRNAYVVPAFEIQEGHKLPVDRKELLTMWQDDIIRPFYSESCWKCQKYTDYSKWRNNQPELTSAYKVEWHDPWEPFYITAKYVPQYDERFKQYGFNRISQVCEMYIAGYQFNVLTDAFLIHKGFKRPEQFHRTKDEEHAKNKLLFRQFKKELEKKYEESERTC